MTSRIDKLHPIAQDNRIDAFLFSSPAAIKYFSGYFFYFEYGPSPFQLLPAALLVEPGTFSTPLDFTNQFLLQLGNELNKISVGRIGVEKNSLPLAIVEFLRKRFPNLEFVNITEECNALRTIKDIDEIEQIRNAAHLSDIGQATVLEFAKPGISELELFGLADLSSGINTASGGGMPTTKTIQEGDIILSDFTPCLNGYWGDSCNSIVVGIPSDKQFNTFRRVKEALEMGIAAIRPGVQVMEIDRIMRRHIGNYPHRSGHGVGVMYHEAPRVVPGNFTELAPNMVIALEPAIYGEDFGVRLEHLVVVTENGCEVLTNFQHRFEQYHN